MIEIPTPVIDRVLDLAVAIQHIPSPTFYEAQRAAFIRDRFLEEGLVDITLDALGNVYARFPGKGVAPPVVLSAHIDTVFPSSTELHLVREPEIIAGPGIGDNSVGVAGLFGLLWIMQERGSSLPGDLWLVANVGEEGLGDLRGMKAVVDRFDRQPLAYIVLEGMALGQVYHSGLDVLRYRISIHTEGGHSWVDYGKPSAVHELSRLVTHLVALELPRHPRTTLNVGVISGGISVNSIAAEAYLELDLRSEDKQVLEELSGQVDKVVASFNQGVAGQVQVKIEVIGQRPGGKISVEHPLVNLALCALEELGITPRTHTGSTDANVPLSRGLPAICLGLTYGSNAHTLAEYIQTSPLAKGLAQLVAVVEGIYDPDFPRSASSPSDHTHTGIQGVSALPGGHHP